VFEARGGDKPWLSYLARDTSIAGITAEVSIMPSRAHVGIRVYFGIGIVIMRYVGIQEFT